MDNKAVRKNRSPLRPIQDVAGASLVEIYGRRRVIIENHRGIAQYENCQICVNTKNGNIVVRGHGLELVKIGKDQLVITGMITLVSLEGREN